jgi:hypothetical protein
LFTPSCCSPALMVKTAPANMVGNIKNRCTSFDTCI